MSMEQRLNELKTSLVDMIESAGAVKNYSDVVKISSQVSGADASTVDEGYGNISRDCVDTSLTQPKTLFVPDNQERDNRNAAKSQNNVPVSKPRQLPNNQIQPVPTEF